jgi:hypothetical protein
VDPGSWVGPPHDCDGVRCLPGEGGAFTWHQEQCALWQDEDEQGNPVGAPYEKHYGWRDTGAPCEP